MESLPSDIIRLILDTIVKKQDLKDILSFSKTCTRIWNIVKNHIKPAILIRHFVENNKTFVDSSDNGAAIKLLVKHGTRFPHGFIAQTYMMYPGILDNYLPIHDDIVPFLTKKKVIDVRALFNAYYTQVIESRMVAWIDHYTGKKMFYQYQIGAFLAIRRLNRLFFSRQDFLHKKQIIDRCTRPYVLDIHKIYLPSLSDPNIVYIFNVDDWMPLRKEL